MSLCRVESRSHRPIGIDGPGVDRQLHDHRLGRQESDGPIVGDRLTGGRIREHQYALVGFGGRTRKFASGAVTGRGEGKQFEPRSKRDGVRSWSGRLVFGVPVELLAGDPACLCGLLTHLGPL